MRRSILVALIAAGTAGTPALGGPLEKPGRGSIHVRLAKPEVREKILSSEGGTAESEAAVERGLRWLQRMQSPDGSWRLDDARFKAADALKNDVAGTAFGLLPFLAAGHTHKDKASPFRATVEKGLLFLVRHVDNKTGRVDSNHYAHALAALTLCEAYALTKDINLKGPAQKAINYVVFAQHDAGGWRYAPKQVGDTSVTSWFVQALKAAEHAKLEVPAIVSRKAATFLDAVCAKDETYGYVEPRGTPNMTAAGLWCRQQLQAWEPKNVRMKKAMTGLALPPSVKSMYYTYYATQVMFHNGGPEWGTWNKKIREELIAGQVKKGDMDGSWDAPPGTQVSGRLMQTSLCILTLQVYYRQTPLFRDVAAGE